MRATIEHIVSNAVQSAINAGQLALDAVPDAPTIAAAVERPRDPQNGDWATTIALRLAGQAQANPRQIAQVIAAHMQHNPNVASVDIAGPGFINLRLSNAALQQVIRNARTQGPDFGRVDVGAGRTLNIEFISANPTGPMHVGHGRWAALGNALANLCAYTGWQVTREFYVNDAGHQMEVFGQSIALRYQELLGIPFTPPEEFYGGTYIIDLAQQILTEEGNTWLSATPQSRTQHFQQRGYTLMLQHMQDLCTRINVPFNTWFSELTLYQPNPTTGLNAVQSLLNTLSQKDLLYDKDGATWLKTSSYSDEKDRVLVKSDGSYTYFAPDIAYHLSKFDRGSEYLINIWGADHHGYIPRMQSAIEALGHAGKLTVVLGQLVNLYRNGEAVRMSKRTGEMITFEELVDEVGADATKYLMLARSTDQPIDFDIEVAKKQDNSNPVYYVQYAHARICSLFKKAQELTGKSNPELMEELKGADLALLVDPSELELARMFSQLSEVIEAASRELAPSKLTRFAEDTARQLHSFYTRCQVIGNDWELTKARLYLSDATRNVLALLLTLLGVTAPERM